MKKIVDKVLSPQAFAIGYLPWLAIYMVTLVNVLDITRVVLGIYAVWAFAICVRTYFFSGKSAWTHKGMAVLLFFLAACLFTQVLQFSYGGFDMIAKLCYFALCLLVLYAQHGVDLDGYFRMLRVLVVVLGIVIGLQMLVSDWMFLEMFSATVTMRSGVTARVGFADNRLFGVFTSPNVGGLFALILIWCSVLLIYWSKDMRAKWVLRIMAAVQIAAALMYISVALSRGTYVSGAVFVASWMLLRMPGVKEKTLAVWKQTAIRVVSAVAALVVCVPVMGTINEVSCALLEWNYERKTAAVETEPATPAAIAVVNTPLRLSADVASVSFSVGNRAAGSVVEDSIAQQIINNAHLGLDDRLDADKEDISNNRFTIWRVHLSLLHGKHYVIGINFPPAFLKASQAAGIEFTSEQIGFVEYAGGNIHNGYLQMLIYGGLLVLVPMMVFLLWCAFRAVRYFGGALFTRRFAMDTRAYALFSVTLPMVLTILSNNIFETNFVLMGASFIQAFFWLTAGACVQSIHEGVTQQ